MHLHKRAWRNVVSAAAIVAFALPLTTPLATSVGATAQTTTPTANTNTTVSIANVGVASPSFAFNPIGVAHTASFTCQAPGVSGIANTSGCFDVTASAQDITTGSAVNITNGTCGTVGATQSGDKVTCPSLGSSLNNATTLCAAAAGTSTAGGAINVPTTFNATTNFCEAPIASATSSTALSGADCAVAGGTVNSAGTACQFAADKSAVATATFNPGANHAYTISFTGYTQTSVGSTCPNGTTPVNSFVNSVGGVSQAGASVSAGSSVSSVSGGQFCPFTVTVQKKYVEITAVTISPQSTSTCLGGALTFAEGLKAFFGPTCVVSASVSGTVVLKTGVNCSDGSEPATGTNATLNGTDFPAGSKYQCVGDTLSVVGIVPSSAVPVTFTVSGPGSTSCSAAFGGLAAGSGATSINSTSGTLVSICPSGAGSVGITACLGPNLPNNQPSVCSTALNVTYTETAARVVPYVRWAGEKIVLTKCFGVGLAGSTIEFTLQGNNPGLNATLLPTNLGSLQGTNNTGTATLATGAAQVFTTADATGCASVIGYADGEGVLNVDAAVYAAGGAQSLINEHAFQVFYLKYDNVTLENIKFQTYSLTGTGSSASSSASGTTGSLGNLSFLTTAAPAVTCVTPKSPLCGVDTTTLTGSFMLPGAPGTGATGLDTVPIATTQYVRAMVHGYFEYPGDPSGRPASNVSIPGATSGTAGSYVLPAGRWVLPEDWPLLATFAGFGLNGQAADFTPSSVLAWDINSGYAFNPTAENAVICGAQGTLIAPSTVESGAISDFAGATTPCFGKDGNGQVYATAPHGPCAGGATIAPFDATQSCTDPFPLKYSPAGAATVGAPKAGAAFALTPAGPNSTYLPNGTLNEWDAPMPPAAVSFGITSGPGYLAQVNKTGLYRIGFAVATPSSGTCPTGFVASTANKDCELELYPDPFYSEAIPASPLIPPTTNNGGYLWDSWGFSFGTVTTSTSVASIASATATGPLQECLNGATSVTLIVTPGTTPVAAGMTVNLTGTSSGGTATLSGVTVNAFNSTSNTLTLDCASLDRAFANSAAAGDFGATGAVALTGTITITGQQFTLGVNNAGSLKAGTGLTLVDAAGHTFTTTIASVNTSNNTVTLNSAQGLAAAFGCANGLDFSSATATCAIGTLVPSGTTLSAGTTSGLDVNGNATSGAPAAAPKNPYPFWQWVPGAPGATAQPSSATVYSDNHGEAVVALQTLASNAIQQAPSSTGTCPTGFTPVNVGSTVVNCLVQYNTLTGFQNIKALPATGCLNTFPSGTTAVATAATIGASGPTAGQICTNTQGGIEFGSAAVLGTTTVNAVADYPYTREHAPVGAASLTKVWTSLFNKSVTVSPAAAGPAGTTAYTVTVTAQDVTGTPLNEPVEVYALGNAGAAVLAPISYGTLVSAGTTSAVVTPNATSGTATFSLEVLNTAIGTAGLVVKVVFPFEKIERFATVISGTTPGKTATVVYPPGWQQVGGPPGSNFSVAEALFTWDPTAGAYTNATASAGNVSSAAPGCTGYWAYFAAAMSISLPANTTSGTTATCTLSKGWNLVGDPFGGAAKIQSGVTAFHWNGTSYDTVGVIPLGGSVWIFNDGTLNTVMLTQE